MATTVNAAFEQFLASTVNLDPDDTATARASRDWLLEQIQTFQSKHNDFPLLYPEINIHYGSFARRTKIRELDDLDMIVGINALGTTYRDYGGTVELTVPYGSALQNLCYDGTLVLNSRRVINKFVKHLDDVPQYENAEIKRNHAAAVLNLKSYPWAFDIVPAFFTTPEFDGRQYYIIPNGDGQWMKTDPRIDQERTTSINQNHDGNVLNVIRLFKYWNREAPIPTMQSYLLECIILDYYESRAYKATPYVDIEVGPFLTYLSTGIVGSVQDPKRIQGNINTLSWEERVAISSRATSDAAKAFIARSAESDGDHRSSINTWREVFGTAFPECD